MKENKSFEKQMMDTGRIPNISAALITTVYVIFFAGIRLEQLAKPSVLALLIVLILQFCVAPLTNKAITKNITKEIQAFNNDELNLEERTSLVKNLMSCPFKITLQVFIVFMIGIGIWTSTFSSFFGISSFRSWLSFGSAILGSYIAGILALNYSEKLCSYYAKRIIKTGINEKIIKRYHYFGISTKVNFILSTIIPIFITNIITLLLFYRIILEEKITVLLLISMLLVITSNSLIIILLSKITLTRVKNAMNQIDLSLTNLQSGNITNAKKFETDLSNEISYTVYLINNVFERLMKILKETQKMGLDVLRASGNLSISTQQTSSTALEQSTAIKEIVASMEDSEALEKNIINHVNEVTLVSEKTSSDVEEGFEILKNAVQNMEEIQDSNNIIISGINGLKNSLKSIQEISELISNIADLTKIIAFNAELEAASLNKTNSNFNHVANEIRQLAENTVSSTHLIKANINSIYETADQLVKQSQEGTKKIDEGVIITTDLHSYFTNLQDSAEETTSSSQQIQNIVEQQKDSQQLILSTLRQLSIGLEDITTSTQNINSQAEKLDNVAHELDINKMEKTYE